MKTQSIRSSRRGLVLMMVMVMMALLATLVMSFLLMVSQTRIPEDAGGVSGGAHDVYSVLSKKAIEQLLVGSDDGTSVMGPHSILENLYGHPVYFDNGGTRHDQLALGGTLSIDVVNNNLLTFSIPKSGANGLFDPSRVSALSQMGTVVTITTPDQGLNNLKDRTGSSLRVVHVEEDSADTDLIKFYMAPCDHPLADFDGYKGDYIINGSPFSGTGIGFDDNYTTTPAGDPRLSLVDGDSVTGNEVYSALRPNPLAPAILPSSSTTGILASRVTIPAPGALPLTEPVPNPFQEYLYSLRYGLTSANPDYTDADYNTMFLAKQTISALPANMGQVISIMPSFHRPGNITATGSDWGKLRKEMMRPLPYDHPEFTGGTPQLAWQTGWAANVTLFSALLDNPMMPTSAYDVDNDGDGVAESIWMNVGLPPQKLPDADGVERTYQPLVSYLVLDLDGRIDINAHGRYVPGDSGFFGGLTGSGSGPAEMDLSGLNMLITGNASATGRYGAAPFLPFTPAGAPVPRYPFERYPGTDLDLPNHPIFGGRIPDLWGTMSANFDPAEVSIPANEPALDKLGQRMFRDTSTFLGSNLLAANPYLFNPNPADTRWQDWAPGWVPDDNVFKLDEFASLLCSRDKGGLQMPRRVRELLFGDGQYPAGATEPYLRNWLTPITADIPSPPMSIGIDLSIYDRILKMVAVNPAAPTPADEANFWIIYNALPDDIRAGRKIDINYAASLNATIPVNPNAPTAAERLLILEEKSRFAQSLFVLLCVICDGEIQSYINADDSAGVADLTQYTYKRLAQWCVNIVDFTDADDTMTPLVIPANLNLTRIDLFRTPTWIGETNTLLAGNPITGQTLWGIERPNVLITETLAFHDAHAGSDKEGAFIELYNASTTNAPGYATDGKIVNLKTPDIWRIAVGNKINDTPTAATSPTFPASDSDPYLGNTDKDQDTPFLVADADISSVIWFATPTAQVPAAATHYLPSTSKVDATFTDFGPAEYLVIGPDDVTPLSSITPSTTIDPWLDNTVIDLDNLIDLANTGSITLPNRGIVKKPKWMVATNGGTGFSLNDTLTGTFGRIPFHKPVFLQRLADPNRAHDPDSNPYITVDWSVFDLTRYDSNPDNAHTNTNPKGLVSRQWGRTSHAQKTPQDVWARLLKDAELTDIGYEIDNGDTSSSIENWVPVLKKWGGTGQLEDGTIDPANNTPIAFDDATCTLGFLNSDSASIVPVGDLLSGPPTNPSLYHGRFEDANNKPFTYLHWNDAPLASSLEVMQVPASSPGRFGLEFNPTASAGYTPGTYGSLGHFTTFSHCLNFFYASNTPGDSLNLAKIFDYIAVPSLFAGTVDPATGAKRYREPGKVNLNTMNELTYNALMGSRTVTMGNFVTDVTARHDEQPFRAADASDRVVPITPSIPLPAPVAVSIVRSDALDSVSGDPLFAKDASSADNTQQALESLQRLSEMTTTRSNTFAVWVTIGLFEVNTNIKTYTDLAAAAVPGSDYAHLVGTLATTDEDYFKAVYPGGVVLGKERGSDGEAVAYRFRDLYIIDRTIPVGFRRGELHNARNTIIHREQLQR